MQPFEPINQSKQEEPKSSVDDDDDSKDAGLKSAQQLTIFYAGMVHVYDNVPADKAHAIMLLAGGGDSCVPHMMKSRYNMALPTETGATPTRDLTAAMDSTLLIPAPERKQPLVARSQAELPFARKASLARFLERRLNRVLQAKAGTSPGDKANISRPGEEPTCPKRLCLRLSSSSPSINMPLVGN